MEFVGEDRIDHTPKNENITIETGKAFDIVAHLYAENRKSTLNGRGYDADMNLTVTNHKNTEADIEVDFSAYYNDDKFEIEWQSNGVELMRQSANLYKFSKKFKPDETFAFEWKESYNP